MSMIFKMLASVQQELASAARVIRAGKCHSRQICSRHRSGVTINAHARTSGKCNAHFLLGKR